MRTPPTVVVFAGLPGTGKSTLADRAAAVLGAPSFAGDWLSSSTPARHRNGPRVVVPIMTDSRAALDHLTRTGTVRLATRTEDGREIVTKIWAVVVDGQAYIRNGYGDSSKWYARIRRTGRAAFVNGGERYDVAAELVTDEATNAQVDDAYSSKYAGSGSALRMMITGDVRISTLRVTPVEG
ncbi:DUF2255 family protein [Jiangella aurantiaca]|uniref:DUF2255 family protein n=1 Tax=Jiangella aurantiaca TaxID=2530373 RepID=A0A4R5A0Z0_9ACTN|nr:DUF2255 family protein [Jiangella aurantiaca]TDD64560.1 DUF2255 family protein [Jiangella aurantiaca]